MEDQEIPDKLALGGALERNQRDGLVWWDETMQKSICEGRKGARHHMDDFLRGVRDVVTAFLGLG
jgi:hypothetical protein